MTKKWWANFISAHLSDVHWNRPLPKDELLWFSERLQNCCRQFLPVLEYFTGIFLNDGHSLTVIDCIWTSTTLTMFKAHVLTAKSFKPTSRWPLTDYFLSKHSIGNATSFRCFMPFLWSCTAKLIEYCNLTISFQMILIKGKNINAHLLLHWGKSMSAISDNLSPNWKAIQNYAKYCIKTSWLKPRLHFAQTYI